MSSSYEDYIVNLSCGRVLEAEADKLDSIPADFIHINDRDNQITYDNWYNEIIPPSSITGNGNYLYQVFDNNGNPMSNYN